MPGLHDADWAAVIEQQKRQRELGPNTLRHIADGDDQMVWLVSFGVPDTVVETMRRGVRAHAAAWEAEMRQLDRARRVARALYAVLLAWEAWYDNGDATIYGAAQRARRVIREESKRAP